MWRPDPLPPPPHPPRPIKGLGINQIITGTPQTTEGRKERRRGWVKGEKGNYICRKEERQ